MTPNTPKGAGHTTGPLYLCRNGHIVRKSWLAGLDCSKCKANDRRRTARATKDHP